MKKTKVSNKKPFLEQSKDILKLSYSRVSDYIKNGPKAIIKRSFIHNSGTTLGSIVDDLLFDIKNFNKKYFILETKQPTASLAVLSQTIIENYTEIPSNEEILEIIKEKGLWKRQKKETLLKNFKNESFYNYVKAMLKFGIKGVISTEDYTLAEEIATILKTHEYSKKYFSDNYESIYQFKFEIKIEKILFRGIFDMLLIDHTKKQIHLIDLKTGAKSGKEFISGYLKWSYYIQEAIYSKAIVELLKTRPDLKEYKLLPFKFLYIGRYQKIPFIYEISDKWHKAALNGFKTTSGFKYKGLTQLIEEIKWHWENKIFNVEKNVHENNGHLIIQDDYIE